MYKVRYDGSCLSLVTVIYDRITFGIAWTPGPYIYTTDWENTALPGAPANHNFAIWKTNKVTGRNEIFKYLKDEPQGIGFFTENEIGEK